MNDFSKTDPFGEAVVDYFKPGWKFSNIQVFSDLTGIEKINPRYLFRTFKEMPYIEQKALQLCKGKVLDVGACAGSHSIYLQENGFDVVSLDISPGCCEVMRKRGLRIVRHNNYFNFSEGTYDTLLFLMNGIGIAGSLEGLRNLLRQAKTLLNPGGKILFDSTDIEYAYLNKDRSKWVNLNSNYYGEVTYKLSYKKARGKAFGWLFIDPVTVNEIALSEGFQFEKLADGLHYDYLGSLKLL